MKKLTYKFLFLLLVVSMASCRKQYLDKAPLDVISDAQVWNDPNLIQAYVVNLYSRAPMNGLFKDFNWGTGLTPCREVTVTDEGRSSYDWMPEVTRWNKGLLNGSGNMLYYWDYNYLRSCNEFLQFIQTGGVSEELKSQYSAEVRFLRAFTYFEKVKRYGGVPLVVEPQKAEEGDALFVTRNTEKEVYDFIRNECDAIADILPEEHTAEMKGRVTRYAALALKSRAMLYAASIAKYGQVQLDGLVGIPPGDANAYWQASLDASNAIIQSGKFHLFNNYPDDKAKNYQMIFLEKDNSEIIMAKKFISVLAGHSVDMFNSPESFKADWGNQINVTIEMVDDYEMVDGSPRAIDWANITGYQKEILKNKDPRLHASVFYNGQPWQGDSVVLYWGIDVDTDGDGIKERLSSGSQSYNGMAQVGKDANGSDATKTGFLLKKYLDESRVRGTAEQSDQDWILFRFGEILLNQAEAAFELGLTGDALGSVNQIRSRAGIMPLAAVTLDDIRHERKIELAFETHRWWDLNRWRLSMTALNKNFKSVRGYYDYATQRFSFEVGSADGYTRVFKPEHYYQPLSESIINNNPNLIENPGY